MEIHNLEELITYCKEKERICPQPQIWNTLWYNLKEKKRTGTSWEPPVPLILAAWHETPAFLKQIRFIEHLTWAKTHGQLNEVVNFILSLSEEQWFHIRD